MTAHNAKPKFRCYGCEKKLSHYATDRYKYFCDLKCGFDYAVNSVKDKGMWVIPPEPKLKAGPKPKPEPVKPELPKWIIETEEEMLQRHRENQTEEESK